MTHWTADAACTEVDPEIFFADADTGWRQMEAALRICAGCPVRGICLEETPDWDRWSVSGGMTARARARMRSTAA